MALNNAINQYSYLLGNGADEEGKPGTFTSGDATTGIEALVTQDDRNSVTRTVVVNETTDTNSSAEISVRNGASADGQKVSGGIGAWSKDYTVTASRTGRVALYSNSDADGPAVLLSSSQDFIMSVPSGPTTLYKMLGTGERTIPLQPCFSAYNNISDLNQTGSGDVITVDFDTEIFDQGSDFSADEFTAPVGGRYLFTMHVTSYGLVDAIHGTLSLITSNRSYNRYYQIANTDTCSFTFSVITDMDSSDTAHVEFSMGGEASNIIDIGGSASFGCNIVTSFSGALLF